MRKQRISSTRGFTIIELLIATAVFSVVLVICTTGFIQVSRIYQKVVIDNQTQDVARSIMANISESIQFSGGDIRTISNNGDSSGFCIDNRRYSYRLNKKVVTGVPGADQGYHGLVTDMVSGCAAGSAQDISGQNVSGNELLSPNMKVLKVVVCVPGDPDTIRCPDAPDSESSLYQVKVIVAYGDSDLIDLTYKDGLIDNGACKTIAFGGSFCAVTQSETTVQKRIIE